MIISRTPFRVSLFGGGTDYPEWYRQHGGAVLAGTIDKYCYLTCRHLPPFFEHRIRVVYSKIENCQTYEEVKHPVVREALRFLGVDRGVEIHHDGDLPARSGMGSSSAFTIGLLHALHALKGELVSKSRLVEEGIWLEQEVLKETVGSQDQVLAAHGGLNHVTFRPTGEISVRPLTLSRERLAALNKHLMLFYTGIKRTASDVAATYVPTIDERGRQLEVLGRLVDDALALLAGEDDLRGFGGLLHESWSAKRSLSQRVSNRVVDDVYDQARAAGAIGGKLLGAGGGGFLLLFVPPENQDSIKRRLSHLVHVPFEFETSGSQIVFFDPEQDYPEEEQAQARVGHTRFRELSRDVDAS
jgi:D-glycero-alpha-D-manno-heptose-7-phosphate kinase